jgi:hypothetical protein
MPIMVERDIMPEVTEESTAIAISALKSGKMKKIDLTT